MLVRSAATRSDESRRRARSVRQTLASSPAARMRLLGDSLSLASNRSSRAKASAADPAKPTRTPAASLPTSSSRRTFTASALAMVSPRLTCPSPAIATRGPDRAEMIVVPAKVCIREV